MLNIALILYFYLFISQKSYNFASPKTNKQFSSPTASRSSRSYVYIFFFSQR